MIKIYSFSLFLLLSCCLSAQKNANYDSLWTYENKLFVGEIKGPLLPLKNGKLSLITKEATQITFRLDEIDHLVSDNKVYERLTFKVGNIKHQVLARLYFKGAYCLYESRTKDLGYLQILKTTNAVIALFPSNYRDNLNAIFDNQFTSTLELKSFRPNELSVLSAKYHDFMEISYQSLLTDDPKGIKWILGLSVAVMIIVALRQV
jgi:hypothetical protein